MSNSFLKRLLMVGLILGLIFGVVVMALSLLGSAIGNVFSGVVSDDFCVWTGMAQAWIDENVNGTWDANESPLPEVDFFVENTLRHQVEDHAIGNWKGEGYLVSDFIPQCSRVAFEVYAEAPSGYQFTTANRYKASGRLDEAFPPRRNAPEGPFRFGFVTQTGVPTTTPRPPAAICTTYLDAQTPQIGNYEVLDVAVAFDGTVWVGTNGGGVAHYDPTQKAWKSYSTADGLASNKVASVTVSPDNTIWLGTDSGVTRFDGSAWVSFATKDGLVSNDVRDIAVAQDGDVWLATSQGASRFDSRTNIWMNYTSGLLNDYVVAVAVAPDGSVWFGTLSGLSHLIPSADPNQAPTWINYSDVEYGHVNQITVADDNTVWFSGNGITHLDPITSRLTVYNARNTNMLGTDTKGLAVALDGSLWIGTAAWRGPDRGGAMHFIPVEGAPHGGTWIIYDDRDGLADNQVPSVALAPDGTVWFGTKRGVTHCVTHN